MTILGILALFTSAKREKENHVPSSRFHQVYHSTFYKQPSGGLSVFELHQSEVFGFFLTSTPMQSSSETLVFGFGGITLV